MVLFADSLTISLYNGCCYSMYRYKLTEGVQPLEVKRRPGKAAELQEHKHGLVDGKEVILIGDSITRNLKRFGPSYDFYFPASTVLNAGIAGDTMEAILYRVEVMEFPPPISHINLFCGTNNVSVNSTISATVIDILFTLQKKCLTATIHLFLILPRFDHFNSQVTHANSDIYFQVQQLFSDSVFFHHLPSSLYNKNMYRGDKVHLTTRGNDILVRWFHHCINIANPHQSPTSSNPQQKTVNPPCLMLLPPF